MAIFTILYGNYYPPHGELKLICIGKFSRWTRVNFTQQYGKNRQRCQQNIFYYAEWQLLLYFYREFPSKILSVRRIGQFFSYSCLRYSNVGSKFENGPVFSFRNGSSGNVAENKFWLCRPQGTETLLDPRSWSFFNTLLSLWIWETQATLTIQKFVENKHFLKNFLCIDTPDIQWDVRVDKMFFKQLWKM